MIPIQPSRQAGSPQITRPAEPLLASSLIDASTLTSIFDNLNVSDTSTAPSNALDALRTGHKSLDDALASTLQPGRLIALSSETSTQRDDLAKSLVVDCLIRYAESAVAVVDSTGEFDVVGLYTRILRHVEKEDVAAKVLDRVKIMRVFDFVGVSEAVGELRDGLEGRAVQTNSVHESTTVAETVISQTPVLNRRVEVADSEDEDEGLEDEDDEMLFDSEVPPAPADPEPAPIPTGPSVIPADMQTKTNCVTQPKLKLILIDNLAHVLTPLLKKDTLSGNTLATTFLTTLSNLTGTYALHTILLNPSTIPRSPSPARQPPQQHQQQAAPPPQQTYTPQPPPPPSIFSSNTTVPALLGLLGKYADAHILLTRMPRKKMDAKVFYADTRG